MASGRRALSAAVSMVVESLESRQFFNAAPVAPVITEPLTDGKVVFASDVHMEIGDFADPDAGDARLNTDWEIWTAGASPQRVWFALGQTGPFDDHHIHLGDGTFAGPQAGQSKLAGNTDYQLRVRTRDNSGDAATNTSPYALRNFHTLAEEQPTAAGWVAQQSGYKVEELPFTFPAGELPFRLPTNIVFVPDAIHGHHADDPLFYVMELYGSIRVVTNNFTVHTYATGLLNYNPSGPISGAGENGSAGLAVDPSNGDLYATMLYDDLADATADTFPKVVRFTSADHGLTGVGTDILKMPGEPMRQSHFISNITFGPASGPEADPNHLYVHIGDGFVSSTSKNLQAFRGKIIRINRDGTAPADNPFYDPIDRGADGKLDAEDFVWAYGYRNPFGGAWRDADGAHYTVENGPSRDRFSKMVKGRNYLYDGTDASVVNYNIAYTADASGAFENGAPDWNPATAPVNLAFVQQSTGNYSGFPTDKWGSAFVALSGPTHAAGPNFAKSIQEWVLNADGTRKVSLPGEPPNPRELVSYEGAGYATAAGIAAGPDGLYFTTLYPDVDANPAGLGAKILRVVYVGTTGPVDQYKFDEATGTAAADSGATPNAGVLTNGPVRVAGTVGAGAVQLDGVNDYVATARDLSSKLGGSATLTAWIKTTQVGDVKMWKSPGITGVEESAGDNDVFWGWLDNTGRIGLMAGDTAGAKSASPVNDGVWHFVAFTRDAASGAVRVYVDGVLSGSAVSAAGRKSTPFNSIGRIEDTGGTTDYFAGALDEVRVYDRVLGDAEIASLMPGGVNTAPTVATPAAAVPDANQAASVNLSVLGADAAGEANLTYTWSVVAAPAGAAAPLFSLNGTNGARNAIATLFKAGSYTFRVTIKDVPGLTVTSDVSVTINAVASSLAISPSGVSVANGGTQQFVATVRDQFNNPLAAQPAVAWSLGAGSAGAISAAGLYTAAATGTVGATVVAAAGALNASTTIAISAGDVTGGLVLNYRLDNNGGTTATDSAGANNGTLTGGAVWSTAKIGASAITLDGVNDYVSTPNNLANTLGGTATLTAWLKTTQVGNVKMYRAPGIAGVEQFDGANDIFWGWLDEAGRVAFKVGDNANVARSTNAVNDGQWHHVAFTRDAASGVIKLYVDGVLNATATSDVGAKTTPFNSFGRIEDTGGTVDYLAGSLDEIRVYNRVLSDAEVLAVKNAGAPQPGASTFVSDLPYQVIANGYGPVEKDKSNGERPAGDGKTLTLNGVTYAKGLGTHANSEVVVNLGGQYATFLADVGVDDEVGNLGKVSFQIYLDDIKVYDSGAMTGASATKSVSVDVTGHNKMQLIVTDGGDGLDDDHGDWANARLLAVDSQPMALSLKTAAAVKTVAPVAAPVIAPAKAAKVVVTPTPVVAAKKKVEAKKTKTVVVPPPAPKKAAAKAKKVGKAKR